MFYIIISKSYAVNCTINVTIHSLKIKNTQTRGNKCIILFPRFGLIFIFNQVLHLIFLLMYMVFQDLTLPKHYIY